MSIEHQPEWNIYRAEGRVPVIFKLPRATTRLEIRRVDGDWLALSEITVTAPGGANDASILLENRWAEPAKILRYVPDDPNGAALGIRQGREWLRNETIQPWLDYTKAGGGVMVGEWGTDSKTPRDVVLRWAADSLKNWQDARWGWALWNFCGEFGILDSRHDDADYENFQGHKLDRKFLNLLQKH